MSPSGDVAVDRRPVGRHKRKTLPVVFSHYAIGDGVTVHLPILFRPDSNHQYAVIGNVSSQSVQHRISGFFAQVSENRKAVNQIKRTPKRKQNWYVFGKCQVGFTSVLLEEGNGLIPGIYTEEVL